MAKKTGLGALGSSSSITSEAGGLAANLQVRNRYWILYLQAVLRKLEVKMKVTGDLQAPNFTTTQDSPTWDGAADSDPWTASMAGDEIDPEVEAAELRKAATP